jgi:hypothetical protein
MLANHSNFASMFLLGKHNPARLGFVALVLATWLAGGACARAATYQVGPTRAYHTLASLPALSPGDAVEIDPATYNEVKRWSRPGTAALPIVVRGVGASRPVFDATGQNVDGVLPHPRAVFQVEADYITLENLEFQNARNGDNGAGIRVTSGNNATVRACRITMCDMGIMSDNNSNLVIEASEIASNGTSLYDGYSHNLYLGGNSATVRCCHIHDSLYGQNFKSRAHYTELLCNYIAASQDGEVGLVDAMETTNANSHAVLIGNLIVSKPRLSGYNSGRFIQFGQDAGGQHNGTLFAFNNTFIAGDGRIQFLNANATAATVLAHNNIFCGSDKVVGSVGGGISGSNNWMQSTATAPATFYVSIKGSDPAFVNRAARDWHLTAASSCRNQGLNAFVYLDGAGAAHSGLPMLEYMNHQQNRPRASDGQTDLGAYEYRVAAFSAIQFAGNDCLLDFITAAGNRYDLQSTSDLVGAFWSPVMTNIPGADGTVRVIDTNAAGQPKRFYRVQSSP